MRGRVRGCEGEGEEECAVSLDIYLFHWLVGFYVRRVLTVLRRVDYLTNVLGMPQKDAAAALRGYGIK